MGRARREWKYLERRPGASYEQLSIRGKRVWAWTLYCEFIDADEPRTMEQLAVDWGVPRKRSRRRLRTAKASPPSSVKIVERMSFWLRRSA